MNPAPPFIPATGLANPHLQTMWGPIIRRPIRLERQRERLWLEDGDFLDLDWHGPHQPHAPLVLLLHGLTGSSSSHYITGVQQTLGRRGCASVAVNWRGCSGEPNLLPRSYHSGASEDLAVVIRHLQAKRPQAPLLAAGYSLGGNILLKYLGEQGADSGLSGAVAVSVPFRLDQCADRIAMGLSKVYQAHFMRALVSYLKEKQRRFRQEAREEGLAVLANLGSLNGLDTFWEFDTRITAPLHGFVDAADYYRQASSRYYLAGIETPTLLIQAEDDPFVFAHSLPHRDELSASTQLELHAQGGHVGFVSGSVLKPRYYLEERVADWLCQQAT